MVRRRVYWEPERDQRVMRSRLEVAILEASRLNFVTQTGEVNPVSFWDSEKLEVGVERLKTATELE